MLDSKLSKLLFLLFIPGIFIALALGPFYNSPAPSPSTPISFTKKIIHPEFISEGVALGDVNQDGQKDILSGPYWFEAPNWQRHELRKPKKFDHTKEWSDSFLNFATDVNQDGWVDFIRIDFPGKGAWRLTGDFNDFERTLDALSIVGINALRCLRIMIFQTRVHRRPSQAFGFLAKKSPHIRIG